MGTPEAGGRMEIYAFRVDGVALSIWPIGSEDCPCSVRVHSTPDLVLAIATRSLVALAKLMRTIPIVVVQSADPWR